MNVCKQPYYLLKTGLMEHSVPYTVAIFLMHIIGYWMFDTANVIHRLFSFICSFKFT